MNLQDEYDSTWQEANVRHIPYVPLKWDEPAPHAVTCDYCGTAYAERGKCVSCGAPARVALSSQMSYQARDYFYSKSIEAIRLTPKAPFNIGWHLE